MRSLVYVFFFLSGACGLVYEVVWARMMTHVFGSTAVAVGTVLAAFMTGLALGSLWLGRLADRSPNPLRLYGILEISVGLAALLAHLLLVQVTPLYVMTYEILGRSQLVLSVARFVLVFGLVLTPTLLMGATLPILARHVVNNLSAVATKLSTLYAINILGAVAGALLAGFHLIGNYGIHGAVACVVVGNVAIGTLAWYVSTRIPHAVVADTSADADNGEGMTAVGRLTYRFLLVGLAISGATSFAYEIYWTRCLVFLLGNSTYAVTTMLTAFLLGLALGGFLVRFIVDRVADRVVLFGWIEILIAVSAILVMPLMIAFGGAEKIRVYLGEIVGRPGQLIAYRFGIAFLLMLVPATLIGTTFPLMARIGVTELGKTGAAVGRIYAVNTLGNVLGALLPGLILLQWWGIQRGILTMAVLNAVVGFAALASRMHRAPRLRWAAPLGLLGTVFVLFLAPLDFRFPAEDQTERHRVLYYREGPSATTVVLFAPETGKRSMAVDGIHIGGNDFTEYKQFLLAHLPKLLSDTVQNELSIGLGSGILAGESARHERVEQITCLEIEPSVAEGAALFEEENYGVLDDSRLKLVINDVINHLIVSPREYDVISADEKTAQDYASNGLSYSTEYYSLLRQRLAPGGLLVQWVPTSLPPGQYEMVLRTFAGAFPHVQLWYFQPAFQDGAINTILVGSESKIPVTLEEVKRRLESNRTPFESLARYGLTTAEAVLTHYVADRETILRAVSHARKNTFTRPRYEFFPTDEYAVPRGERHRRNHRLLMRLRREAGPSSLIPQGGRMKEALAAESEFLAGFQIALDGGMANNAFRHFEAALSLAPWNDNLRSRISMAYREVGSMQAEVGENRMALLLLAHAVEVYGESAATRLIYGDLLFASGQTVEAMEQARLAVDMEPKRIAARRLLVRSLIREGREEEARQQIHALLELEPGDKEARRMLQQL